MRQPSAISLKNLVSASTLLTKISENEDFEAFEIRSHHMYRNYNTDNSSQVQIHTKSQPLAIIF